MLVINSFIKAIMLAFNWKIALGILLYAVSTLGFTLLFGMLGLLGKDKNKFSFEFGAGCLWTILGPIWQALVLAFFIGSISNIVLGGNSYDFQYAFSNLGRLWLCGLAGVVFVLILSIMPFFNMVLGGPHTGIFWYSIPIVIATFSGARFWSGLGLAFSFFWENFFVMIGFALLAYVITILGGFLSYGIVMLLSAIIRQDIDSPVMESLSFSMVSFLVAIFEFIPILAFINYFISKYGKIIKNMSVEEAGINVQSTFWFIINLAIAGVIVFFFHLLIKKLFVKRKMRNKETVASQEISDNQELIKFLKGYCLFYLFILLLSLIVMFLVAIFFPHFYRQFSSSIFGEHFIAVAIFVYLILWIVVLTYLYKVSRLLKLSGNLGIRPSLIIIFTIVSSYTFPLLAFIPFLVIWIKSNAYLRYETKTSLLSEP